MPKKAMMRKTTPPHTPPTSSFTIDNQLLTELKSLFQPSSKHFGVGQEEEEEEEEL